MHGRTLSQCSQLTICHQKNEAVACLPQVPINNSVAKFPSQTEMHTIMRRMSSGKAPGSDSSPVEVYAAGGLYLIGKLTELFQPM